MFTGLIAETGRIVSVAPTQGAMRIVVNAPTLAKQLREGDSIAVSGVCLTALDIKADQFTADLAAETIARTSLSRLQTGSVVNLELPTASGSPLGGHIVQGHVDGVARLLELSPLHPEARETTDWILRIDLPGLLERYVVEKGSITIEGISLTVAKIESGVVTVAIIPHTYAATNLHTLKVGAEVNIEVDVMAKYAEQRASQEKKQEEETITELSLIAEGY
ncbi:MAG: riboflavin synthase [Acidobacteria bacterium]|nr:riboflavin synthase [Acidobacteriota bacterium]